MNLIKIQSILDQEMTRKEFLRVVGLGLLGLIGINSLFANLNLAFSSMDAKALQKKSRKGYGTSVYGR